MHEALKIQEQAAAFLGVKPATLAMWRYQGRGPKYFKVGRSCFYRESEIEAWLDEQAIGPVPKTTTSDSA